MSYLNSLPRDSEEDYERQSKENSIGSKTCVEFEEKHCLGKYRRKLLLFYNVKPVCAA